MNKGDRIVIGVLKGPITAAFRRDAGRWLCTALQFDIVGIGDTRDEARSEMQALVNAYLENIIRKPGPVEFYNHAEAEEWQGADKEHFLVAFAFAGIAPEVLDAKSLSRYRSRIRDAKLIPCPDVPTMVPA
jgi:hypothetical protein